MSRPRSSWRSAPHHKSSLTRAAPTAPDRSARVYWIAGLAGLGILLVGGIALAAKKPSPGPSPSPTPTGPGPHPLPTSSPPVTPVQLAAVAMAQAIVNNGYRLVDQCIYKSFQTAAGLSPVDGFPGTGTMTKLNATLQPLGVTIGQLTNGYTKQPIQVFQWLSTCSTGSGDQCYNGTDAPTLAEWQSGGSTAPTC